MKGFSHLHLSSADRSTVSTYIGKDKHTLLQSCYGHVVFWKRLSSRNGIVMDIRGLFPVEIRLSKRDTARSYRNTNLTSFCYRNVTTIMAGTLLRSRNPKNDPRAVGVECAPILPQFYS